jgi:signal transduction histidine kinase
MNELIAKLLSIEFMPHGHCYFWQSDLLWLHTASDVLISASYFSIPAALIWFVKRRGDLEFDWMFWMFGGFIFACGTTHVMNIVTTWTTVYRLEGGIKLVTALISLATAVALSPLVRKALLLPSPSQLAAANDALQAEVAHRQEAEAQVLRLNRGLEARVEERTAMLEQINRELESKAEALARANAELERFAYAVSHDLKAPLQAIDKLSTWIEEDLDGRLEGSTVEHMNLLRGRVARMEGLLDGLLEYARAGRSSAGAESLDTAQLIEEIAQLLGPPAGFEIVGEAPLPTLETARAPFQQVLQNLIANGFKHHDREQGRITVAARRDHDGWEFEVRDDGPGISPDFHDKVFAIFQTLKPRDQLEAAGMGLAIVKKVIEEVGGRVSIDRHEGRGTTVRFTWPERW